MIKYQLQCAEAHEFEGWFGNSSEYDQQESAGLLSCPHCGSADVKKALMAPAIAKRGRNLETSSSDQAKIEAFHLSQNEKAKAVRDYVETNFENVGDKFPDEARKIHYGEAKERGIYGEASPKEVKELVDEGVTIAPLPSSDSSSDLSRDKVKRDKLN